MNVYPTGTKTIYLFDITKKLIEEFAGAKACAEFLKCSARGVNEAIKRTSCVQGCYYVSHSKTLTVAPKKLNHNLLEGKAHRKGGLRCDVPVLEWADDDD